MMSAKWFKLNTCDIAPVQFILEGYEGLCTVSTIDAKTAILQILIMPDFIEDMENILQHLKEDYSIQEIPAADDREPG